MAVVIPAIFALTLTSWLSPVLQAAVLAPARCLQGPASAWIPPVPRRAQPQVNAAGIRRPGMLKRIPAAAGMINAAIGPP